MISDRDLKKLAAALRGPEMAFDVAASSASWNKLLYYLDRGTIRLSQQDENRVLDELARQLDAERAAARRALEDRIARERRVR